MERLNTYRDTSYSLYRFAVTASGLSQAAQYRRAMNDFNTAPHLDKGNGTIYFDNGSAARPDTGQPVGLFPGASAVLLDSTNGSGKLFAYYPSDNTAYVVSYDINHFVPTAIVTLANAALGTPHVMACFGQNGLAVLTPTSIYLVSGTFVH